MSETVTKILDTAQELIQTHGYTAMSFQDIAKIVDIKKPSIIYHFPNKGALGAAVIHRYRHYYADQMTAIQEDIKKTATDAIAFYFSPYLQYAGTSDKVCLVGALASEVIALPPEMREEIKHFMSDHQAWLTKVLQEGKENGEFHFSETPQHMAQMLFSSLQGALLVKRATGDINQVQDVICALKESLKPNAQKQHYPQ